MKIYILTLSLLFCSFASASINPNLQLLKNKYEEGSLKNKQTFNSSFIFDIPITYNKKVGYWIQYFQTRGNKWFRLWLERSYKHMPMMKEELQKAGLPQDLAFMAMVESGFSTSATSHADAVGPWQFIQTTGERYGLRTYYWLDERRDFKKSTLAAIRYMKDLYREFGSWYLVAASYNMGESGLRRTINKHQSNDFWTLANKGALPQETTDYVPKILAAMLISKAPHLYGFRDIDVHSPIEFEAIEVPGGTEINEIADHISVTRKSLQELNSELLLGYVPKRVERHYIRVPRGATKYVEEYLQIKNKKVANNGVLI